MKKNAYPSATFAYYRQNQKIKKNAYLSATFAQYAHGVVLTSIQRRFNAMDVAWTSKRRRVLTGTKVNDNNMILHTCQPWYTIKLKFLTIKIFWN